MELQLRGRGGNVLAWDWVAPRSRRGVAVAGLTWVGARLRCGALEDEEETHEESQEEKRTTRRHVGVEQLGCYSLCPLVNLHSASPSPHVPNSPGISDRSSQKLS